MILIKVETLIHITVLKMYFYLEMPLAHQHHLVYPSAQTIIPQQLKPDDDEIYFPFKNESAMWIYLRLWRKTTDKQAILLSSLLACYTHWGNISYSVLTMLGLKMWIQTEIQPRCCVRRRGDLNQGWVRERWNNTTTLFSNELRKSPLAAKTVQPCFVIVTQKWISLHLLKLNMCLICGQKQKYWLPELYWTEIVLWQTEWYQHIPHRSKNQYNIVLWWIWWLTSFILLSCAFYIYIYIDR